MSIIQIAIGAMAGGSIGFVTASMFAAGKFGDFKSAIAALNDHHERDTKELTQLGDRCSQLRIDGRSKDETIEKQQRRIAELEPLAERGRRAIDQHKAASRAGLAAAAAKRAAKAAGNVTPITTPARITAPKRPTRKSAIAG